MNTTRLSYLADKPLTFQATTDLLAHLVELGSPLLSNVTVLREDTDYQNGVLQRFDEPPIVNEGCSLNAPLQIIDPRAVLIETNKKHSVRLGVGTCDNIPAEQMVKNYLVPAAEELVLKLETELAKEIAPFIPSTYVSGQTMTWTDLVSAVQMAEGLGGKTGDRVFLLNALAAPQYADILQVSQLPTDSQEKFRTRGEYQPMLGWTTITQRSFGTHNGGDPANVYGLTVASPLNTPGSTTLVINVVGGGTLNKGDSLHVAGHRIMYKVQENATANASGEFTLKVFPPLQSATPANLAVLIYVKTGPMSLLLWKKCVAVLSKKLPIVPPEYGGGLYANGVTPQGINIRLIQHVDKTTRSLVLEADMVWGAKVVNPHLGVFIY